MATTNVITIKNKRVAQSETWDFIEGCILNYGEPLYISNHGATNDYLTVGGFNNNVETPAETVGTHNQYLKLQKRTKADRQVFYNDTNVPTNASIQLYNDKDDAVYPKILPTVRVKNFTTSNNWTSEGNNIYSLVSPDNFKLTITTNTKINLSASADVIQTMLTNNIYSIHAENIEIDGVNKVKLYACAFIDPSTTTLNLQASMEEVAIEVAKGETFSSIIGSGIVASDGNNIEVGNVTPGATNKSKLWVNSTNKILYYKTNTDWAPIGGTFG